MGPAEQQQPESGPSISSSQTPAARPPTVPIPLRYEEEEEEEEEEDVYAPELPPDLAAARANPPRRAIPIGPARGPLRREEEEEESEDEEIGPAPPAGAGPSHMHEDAVIEFMQKEAQRRQAIEVGVNIYIFLSGFSPVLSSLCAQCACACTCTRVVSVTHFRLSSTGGGAPQDAQA
jgi:hypothetical protein